MDALASLLASTDRHALGALFPWRRAETGAVAGQDVCIPLTIDNTDDTPATLTLYSTDLVGDSGYRIPAELIAFDPPSQTVPPRGQGTTRMKIAVPLQAAAGSYSALVQTVGLQTSKAVVTLDVL